MEKATLIKLRDLAYKATMTLYNKNKDCPEDKRTLVVRCPLNIVCVNSLNISWVNMVWLVPAEPQ